jgi:hypothetical protein
VAFARDAGRPGRLPLSSALLSSARCFALTGNGSPSSGVSLTVPR